MWIVIAEFEVLALECKNILHLWVDLHRGQAAHIPRNLLAGLVHVIQIQVHIAEGVDEITRLQITSLGHYHREQSIGCNVEGDAKEGVGRALIELAVQAPILNVKLKQAMARRQGHVIDKRRIPRADHVPAAVRLGFDPVHELGDLVRVGAVGVGPISPLVPLILQGILPECVMRCLEYMKMVL